MGLIQSKKHNTVQDNLDMLLKNATRYINCNEIKRLISIGANPNTTETREPISSKSTI